MKKILLSLTLLFSFQNSFAGEGAEARKTSSEKVRHLISQLSNPDKEARKAAKKEFKEMLPIIELEDFLEEILESKYASKIIFRMNPEFAETFTNPDTQFDESNKYYDLLEEYKTASGEAKKEVRKKVRKELTKALEQCEDLKLAFTELDKIESSKPKPTSKSKTTSEVKALVASKNYKKRK
jgi:hypothetical protein